MHHTAAPSCSNACRERHDRVRNVACSAAGGCSGYSAAPAAVVCHRRQEAAVVRGGAGRQEGRLELAPPVRRGGWQWFHLSGAAAGMHRLPLRSRWSRPLLAILLLLSMAAGQQILPQESLFQQRLLVDVEEQVRSGVSTMQARSSSYGGYGGCSDAFSVFGFLAFLLALLDLIMDLQGNANDGNDGGDGDGGRRRRDLPPNCSPEPELVEASLASYAMLRSFVNILHTEEEQCGQRFLCEGAQEAAQLGDVGRVVARVASLNAAGWLRRRPVSARWRFTPLTDDPAGGTCHRRYPNCTRLPDQYRYPDGGGVPRARSLLNVDYAPVLQFVSDTVHHYL